MRQNNMPLTVSDKYLPNIAEITAISDADLFYIVGSDYGSTMQSIRGLMNPCRSSTIKLVNYSVQVSDCDGRFFTNRGAPGTITFTLPAVADNLIVSFYVGAHKNLVITPQAGEVIAQLTIAGQSLTSDTVGSSLVLRATDYAWFVMRKGGTWGIV